MKIFARLPLALVYLCVVAAIGVSNSVRAGSATWDLNPGSGDWNTAMNWTPATAPNGSADTATFATSNTTAISISANTTVDGITFSPGASSFTITASPSFSLTLSGTGITNNSGTTQNFVAAPSGAANAIRLFFKNSATAGSGTFFTMNGGATLGGTPGWTLFDDSSSASHGTFTNNGPTVQGTFGGGATIFNKSATASNGTFINNGGTVSSQFGGDQGLTAFNDTSTAANGIFTNNAGMVSGAHGGTTAFSSSATAANATITNYGAIVNGASGGVTSFSGLFGTATAGNATIINNGGNVSGASGGKTSFEGFFEIVSPGRRFFGSSTAGNATIINNGGDVSGAGGGETVFFTDFNSSNPLGASTAGNATLIANGGTGGGQGGAILFKDFSTGGTSRIEVFGNGRLDISPHNAPGVTIGSIEGSGNVFLGRNNLTVGSKNLTTTFSGVIQDGGANAGSGGSLTKIGSGTLVLAGANTYTGNTNINSGVLQVDGSITSNTFVNHGGTLAGAGTVMGNVINNFRGMVRPGDDAPGTLTVDNYTQMSGSTLQIEIAGPNTGQFSVLDVLGNAIINPNGLLDPVLQDGFVPTVGESFTFMDYAALSGTFFIFDRNIDNAIEHWDVTYQSKYAILTVAPGNVPVPDQGRTLLLLTLSFLFLLMCRYLFLCKQACI